METIIIYELARKNGSYETITFNEDLSLSEIEKIKSQVLSVLPDIDSDQAEIKETNYEILPNLSKRGSINMKILRLWVKAEFKWSGTSLKCRDVYTEVHLRIDYNIDISDSVKKAIEECAKLGVAAAAIAMAGTLNVAAGWAAFNAVWLPCIKAKIPGNVLNALKLKIYDKTVKSNWHNCT